MGKTTKGDSVTEDNALHDRAKEILSEKLEESGILNESKTFSKEFIINLLKLESRIQALEEEYEKEVEIEL